MIGSFIGLIEFCLLIVWFLDVKFQYFCIKIDSEIKLTWHPYTVWSARLSLEL
jgi:hypothetical protein